PRGARPPRPRPSGNQDWPSPRRFGVAVKAAHGVDHGLLMLQQSLGGSLGRVFHEDIRPDEGQFLVRPDMAKWGCPGLGPVNDGVGRCQVVTESLYVVAANHSSLASRPQIVEPGTMSDRPT